MNKVGLKREIDMLAGDQGLEDLNHMTYVFLVRIHSLKSMLEGVCRLNTIRHPSDDG